VAASCWCIWRRNETVAIDYRETAPAAMTRDVFLDDKGEADPKKSRDSALGVGVPGTVAGLALALEKYGSGKFTLADLIAPAIKLAREGIAVEDDLADSLPRAQPRLARWPASAKIFLKSDGTALGRRCRRRHRAACTSSRSSTSSRVLPCARPAPAPPRRCTR
jgi:gamma-glutamyltranspeptidase/glutathione hydrolase